MLSLRFRLLIGTALGTASVLLIAGMALYVTMRASLMAEFDHALNEKAVTLSAMIVQDDDEIELEFSEAQMAEFERADRPEYFQVWQPKASVLERSPSLNDGNLPFPDRPIISPSVAELELPDGRPGRVATVQFTPRLDEVFDNPPDRARLTLALARDTLGVEATLAKLRWLLLLVGAVATVTSVGVLAWLVGVGLKPADRLAQKIGGMNETRLSEHLDPAGLPRELEPIAIRLNEFLDRLDAAFAREKTMTADVAHELRTPLAGLRSTLEVALTRDRAPEIYREAMADCLAICRQTQTIVENLLALARLDAGTESVRRERADIEKLLQEAWKPHSGAAREKKLDVRWTVEPGLEATTDPDKLQLVLGNLLGNAVHYVNPGGHVSIDGHRPNGSLRLSVANSGSRLSAESVAHVFERFWRGDIARRMDGVHCGLGLALCKTLIDRLGGTIRAEAVDNGVFRITVDL